MLGLPIAVALGMGREAIGATYSVGREPNIAIIADKYTLDSPEGRGVMATYLMGTLFGAVTVSMLASIIGSFDILHPYALAVGAGVGSGSMMAAATGSIVIQYPAMEAEIRAYAGAANLMSSILGIYIYMFFSPPFAVKMYSVFSRLFGKKWKKQGRSPNDHDQNNRNAGPVFPLRSHSGGWKYGGLQDQYRGFPCRGLRYRCHCSGWVLDQKITLFQQVADDLLGFSCRHLCVYKLVPLV